MKRQIATWHQLDRPPTVVYQAKSDRVQTWKLCEGGRAAFTPFPYKSHCCARRRTTDFYVQPVLILSSTPQFVQSPNERVESIQNSHRVSYVNYEAIDRGIKKKKNDQINLNRKDESFFLTKIWYIWQKTTKKKFWFVSVFGEKKFSNGEFARGISLKNEARTKEEEKVRLSRWWGVEASGRDWNAVIRFRMTAGRLHSSIRSGQDRLGAKQKAAWQPRAKPKAQLQLCDRGHLLPA